MEWAALLSAAGGLGGLVRQARCEEAISEALLLALGTLAERPTARPVPH